MSRRRMAEQWIARINDYRASGEGVQAWCARNQVSSKQLYYWMAKLKNTDQHASPTGRPRWVALSVAKPAPAEAAPILVRVGTTTVEVRAGFEPAVFAEVARALKALC
jgi:transposase-like protein